MELLDLYGIIASEKQTQDMIAGLEARGVNFDRQLQFRQRGQQK